ncbi:MAG: type III pantothenate kinase [bacterium]
MKLVIDIGNTRTKIALYHEGDMTDMLTVEDGLYDDLLQFLTDHPGITSAILSSVRDVDETIPDLLRRHMRLLMLSDDTPLPFHNKYLTPETLGRDRIAAAAAGMHLFPDRDVLVIDAGTCITYDIITAAGEYLGGAISPGLKMRFEAMHRFTGKLPLVNPNTDAEIQPIGNTTKGSLLAGGQRALLEEVDGMINRYREAYPDLTVVVGGGDYKYFDKYLKNNIFAAPNLVLAGLKKILDFNEG